MVSVASARVGAAHRGPPGRGRRPSAPSVPSNQRPREHFGSIHRMSHAFLNIFRIRPTWLPLHGCGCPLDSGICSGSRTTEKVQSRCSNMISTSSLHIFVPSLMIQAVLCSSIDLHCVGSHCFTHFHVAVSWFNSAAHSLDIFDAAPFILWLMSMDCKGKYM